MGQAKSRGTFADRVAQSQKIQAKEEPVDIPCQTCKEVLNGFTLISHSPAGALWQCKCACGAITSAVVQAENSNVQRAFRSTLKAMDQVAGKDKKTSVQFIEKSPYTIDMGMIPLH